MSWHSMLSQNRVEGFDQDQSDTAKEPRWLIPPPQFVVKREILCECKIKVASIALAGAVRD